MICRIKKIVLYSIEIRLKQDEDIACTHIFWQYFCGKIIHVYNQSY
jgi:hypothetical protein